MGVPRFAVLKIKSSGQYLCYRKEESTPRHGFIVPSKVEVVSPFVKLELEPAKTGDGLANIRFCQCNKYWVRCSEDEWWIVAGADEPNEDRSKSSCTLFEPVPYETRDEDGQYIRLRHVGLNAYAHFSASRMSAKPNDRYGAGDDVFKVIDLESLMVLPKYVTFKGDNERYLGVCWFRDHPFLQFSRTDAADQSVRHEVFIVGDGMVRIKAHESGKFWRSSPCWIWADSTDDISEVNNETSNLFWPVKVGPNTVALRHIGLNRFCKRLTDYWENCLNAATPSITREARLVIEEPVLSREIYNINYHIVDARIYDKKERVAFATQEYANWTEDRDSMQLKFSCTDTRTHTWKSSVGLKLNVKAKFKVMAIPIIGESEIEVSTELSSGFEYGETNTKTQVIESTYTGTVSPRSRAKVTAMVSQAKCDVAFSYTQRDTLTSGETMIYHKDDGIYTGVNCFKFEYVRKEEPL